MDTKKAIHLFQYSEKLKSELIIASKMLTTLTEVNQEEERRGAEKMMISYLNGVISEIRIAQALEMSINFLGAEKKVLEAAGRIRLNQYSEAAYSISEALSHATTSCQRTLQFLIDQGLA
ncbi:MAG: hypothetical protein DRG20_00665 [Deltaproteobacteria bacterium]|nr:hypothetical protein [Deltaproteobacteria bacterium]RLA91648.1 MAG: hypothetical protein DRG20_00665 [Deltaproteobacteria bacterium]